jgi:hypothetical protein
MVIRPAQLAAAGERRVLNERRKINQNQSFDLIIYFFSSK